MRTVPTASKKFGLSLSTSDSRGPRVEETDGRKEDAMVEPPPKEADEGMTLEEKLRKLLIGGRRGLVLLRFR